MPIASQETLSLVTLSTVMLPVMNGIVPDLPDQSMGYTQDTQDVPVEKDPDLLPRQYQPPRAEDKGPG